jgi:pimeloyl-ACP methyl ester carboxylesterase
MVGRICLAVLVVCSMNGCATDARSRQVDDRGVQEPMIRTVVNDLPIFYARRGHGPVLVLLHGFTQDSRVWRPQLEDLADRFTVIAWDAPGAGRSADPPATFTSADWADALAAVLDAAAVARAHVLGLSWGGLIAQEFYRRHASRVLSLVLVGTYAGWAGSLPAPVPEERLAACMTDASLPPSEFVPKYLPGMFSDSVSDVAKEELAHIMSATHPLGFRLMATALARADTRDLLPTIRVPTLLIWGDADKRSPMRIAHQLRDAIPSAKLAVLDGAGHVSNLEAPARFNLIVREFLASQSPPAAAQVFPPSPFR